MDLLLLKKKMDELKKVKEDVNTTGNLYDHIYYLVAVDLDRVKKVLHKLPSDMLDKYPPLRPGSG